MKNFLALLILFSVSAVARAEGETIIDPSLMNQGVWAEPHFRGAGENPRGVAADAAAGTMDNESAPSQYLDVLEKIPHTEPSLHRSWVEHRILNSDD